MPPVVTPRGPGARLAGGPAVSSASAWPVALAVCWPVAWQCARPGAPQCARPVARRWPSAPTKFALSEHRAGRQLAVPISRHSAALGRPVSRCATTRLRSVSTRPPPWPPRWPAWAA